MFGRLLGIPNLRRINQSAFEGGRNYTEDFYVYSVQFGNVAAAGIAPQQSITVQADSSFEWIMSTWSALVNGQAAPFLDDIIAPLSVTIQDGGAGRNLFSAPVFLSSIAGLGRQPFYLPVPRIFMSKSQIMFNLTNNDPAATYNQIQWNLIGRKIFSLNS